MASPLLLSSCIHQRRKIHFTVNTSHILLYGWTLGHHWRFYNQLPPLLTVFIFLQKDVPFMASPLSDVVFTSFSLSTSSSPSLYCSCRTDLARPDDHVTCPYYLSLCLFTKVRSPYDPMACSFLFFTSLLVKCDLRTRYQGVCGSISPLPVSFCQRLLQRSMFHMLAKILTWPGNTSVWSWSQWRCACCSRWLLVWSRQLWSGLSWRILWALILHPIL